MDKQENTYPAYDASTPATYLATRVDNQIAWYDRRSGQLKRRYRWLKILTIVIGGLVPVCIALSEKVWEAFKYVAAVFGALISIFEGISGMLKYKDTFLGYRAASEALVREKMQYQSKAGKYAAGDAAFAVFVEACENIMAGEISKWSSTHQDNAQNQGDQSGTGK
jgi:hypothetical protein